MFQAVLGTQKETPVLGYLLIVHLQQPSGLVEQFHASLAAAAGPGTDGKPVLIGGGGETGIQADNAGDDGELDAQSIRRKSLDIWRDTAEKLLNLSQHGNNVFLGGWIGFRFIVIKNFLQFGIHKILHFFDIALFQLLYYTSLVLSMAFG